MKLGFFTDTHLRATTPEGRTDDFAKSILVKLEEIGEIFNQEKVEAVLFGGDLFNSPDSSYSIVYDAMSVLKAWNKRIVGIVGSHDYYGYQMKSLKRTALGLVVNSGIIELVGVEGHSSSITLEGGVDIFGTSHNYWLDQDPQNYRCDRISDNYMIQLAHGNLQDKPVIWEHQLVGNIKTDSNLVLSGHYHPGWEKPILIENTTFINSGAIARLDNTGKERIPRVLIIDTVAKSNFKFVKLKTAQKHPFKEKLKESKENVSMDSVAKVINLLQTSKVNLVDVKQQLPGVAITLGYPFEIVEEAFALIEEAESGN